MLTLKLTTKQATLLDAAASDGLLEFMAESVPDGSVDGNTLLAGDIVFTVDQAEALHKSRGALDDTDALVAALAEIGEDWTARSTAAVAGALEGRLRMLGRNAATARQSAAESPQEPTSDVDSPETATEPPTADTASPSAADDGPYVAAVAAATDALAAAATEMISGIRAQPSRRHPDLTVYVPWCSDGWEGPAYLRRADAIAALADHLAATQ